MGRVSHLHTPLVSQNRLKRKINPGKHDVYWEFRMYVSFVVCETCAIFFFYLKLSWWRTLGSGCFGTNFTDLKIRQSFNFIKWIMYLSLCLENHLFFNRKPERTISEDSITFVPILSPIPTPIIFSLYHEQFLNIV